MDNKRWCGGLRNYLGDSAQIVLPQIEPSPRILDAAGAANHGAGGAMRGIRFRLTALASMVSVTGCAVNVPHMGDLGVSKYDRMLKEIDLLGHIQCELHVAYDRARDIAEYEQSEARKRNIENGPIKWIDNWGVKINIEFQDEVKSAITPGISVTDTLQNAVEVLEKNGNVTIGRTRGGKFGAGITSDITRTETIAYFFPFSNFRYRLLPKVADGPPPITLDASKYCEKKTHIESDDDLQIFDFLRSKLKLAATPGSSRTE